MVARTSTLTRGDLADVISEIVFNPLRYWFTRGGPFTKLFRTFLWSPIPPHAKWSILAYMFSYYALSISWSLSLLNFVLIGLLGMLSATVIEVNMC